MVSWRETKRENKVDKSVRDVDVVEVDVCAFAHGAGKCDSSAAILSGCCAVLIRKANRRRRIRISRSVP